MDDARHPRWLWPAAGVGFAFGALAFPYCLALGYWNGRRHSRFQDVGLFVVAILIPYVLFAIIRPWTTAAAVVYPSAIVVTVVRFLWRRRGGGTLGPIGRNARGAAAAAVCAVIALTIALTTAAPRAISGPCPGPASGTVRYVLCASSGHPVFRAAATSTPAEVPSSAVGTSIVP